MTTLWTILIGLVGLVLLAWLAFRVAVTLGGLGVRPVDPPSLVRRPVEAARVTRQADGSLRVRWSQPAREVRLSAGLSPEHIDWDRPLQVVRSASEALLTGLDPALRHYIGLAFVEPDGQTRRMVAAERHLPLRGARNLRDLGGYRTAGGRSVRWGRIFRSEHLSDLTAEDQAYLERVGIRAVCDLRNSDERARHPDRLPGAAAYHVLPIYEDQPRARLMNILLFRRNTLGRELGKGYIEFVEQGAQSYAQLLRLAAQETPILFHCASGKDRAGIAAALLLALLGVPDETILADYSLSNLAFDHLYEAFVRTDRLRPLGVPNHQVQALFVVEIAWLEALLAYIRQTYGTVEEYLVQRAGLEPEIIDQLRAELLVE